MSIATLRRYVEATDHIRYPSDALQDLAGIVELLFSVLAYLDASDPHPDDVRQCGYLQKALLAALDGAL